MVIFTGDFETHITVSLNNEDKITALQRWGIDHGLSFLHIVLERGKTISQPMLTLHGQGDFDNELRQAMELAATLKAADFSVARVKIEAVLGNRGIPQDHLEALNQHQHINSYFEHHIKLMLESDVDISSLVELATRHSAHLSRNAWRVCDHNRVERFVTQRCRSISQVAAREQLEKLLDEIRALAHPIIKVEEEFVLYDNNLAIDDGWLQ
ncbi:MAG: hypothetical protein AB1489_37195 [Acidobacteriota bacterium]